MIFLFFPFVRLVPDPICVFRNAEPVVPVFSQLPSSVPLCLCGNTIVMVFPEISSRIQDVVRIQRMLDLLHDL